jgi:integrase
MPSVAPYCVPGGIRVVSNRVRITACGAHPRLVQELLGHTFVTMTIDRYAHVLPSMGEQTALAMDAVLS